MRKLLLAIVAVAFVASIADAQRILVRGITQAQADTAEAGDFRFREILFTTDTHRFYVGIHTGVVRIGLDSLGNYAIDGDLSAGGVIDFDSLYNTTRSDGAANVYVASDGKLYRTTDTVDVAPASGYIMVPSVPGWSFTSASSSTGFTNSANNVIYAWGQYLPTAIKLGKVALYTGSLTGSSPIRVVNIGVYNASKELVDSTGASDYVTSDVMPMNFTQNAIVGPGWVYFTFSVYFSTTGTMRFNVAAADVSFATGAILSGQSTTYPIISTATETLTAGSGLPATLTLTRNTSSFQLPVMHIWGTDVD